MTKMRMCASRCCTHCAMAHLPTWSRMSWMLWGGPSTGIRVRRSVGLPIRSWGRTRSLASGTSCRLLSLLGSTPPALHQDGRTADSSQHNMDSHSDAAILSSAARCLQHAHRGWASHLCSPGRAGRPHVRGAATPLRLPLGARGHPVADRDWPDSNSKTFLVVHAPLSSPTVCLCQSCEALRVHWLRQPHWSALAPATACRRLRKTLSPFCKSPPTCDMA